MLSDEHGTRRLRAVREPSMVGTQKPVRAWGGIGGVHVSWSGEQGICSCRGVEVVQMTGSGEGAWRGRPILIGIFRVTQHLSG